MPRTRIAYVIGTLERGGAEGQIVELASGLDRARFEPTVRCLARGGPLAATLAARGVRVVAVGREAASGGRSLLAIPSFWRLLRRLRPGVVHGQLYWGNAAAAMGGPLACVPAVVGSRPSLARPPRRLRAGPRRLATSWTEPRDRQRASRPGRGRAGRGAAGRPSDRHSRRRGLLALRRRGRPEAPGCPRRGLVEADRHLRRSKGHAVFLEARPRVLLAV